MEITFALSAEITITAKVAQKKVTQIFQKTTA